MADGNPAHDGDIQIDDRPQSERDDTDSTLGSDSGSDITSLSSSITKYRYENGRRYHAYKDGAYWGPNDEKANNQLDIGHHLFTLTFGGKLFLAPITSSPQKVLDVGTGTGIWAIDFADMYPSAQVIGTDLSPIQPGWVPPNVQFEVDDACDFPWARKQDSFDFIHVRSLYGSVSDWDAFYQEVYKHLKPGAWFEQVEMAVRLPSDDDTVGPDHVYTRWGNIFEEAAEKIGKTFKIWEQSAAGLKKAGFQNVVEKKFKMPIGPWARDPKLKEIGQWNQLHCEEGIEGWSIAHLTRVMNWTLEEAHVLLAEMRVAIRDRNIHAYLPMSCVYGQKPIGGTPAV